MEVQLWSASLYLFIINCVFFSTGMHHHVVLTKCTNHSNEMMCFGRTKEFCYLPEQRCDGESNCPYSHLADEALCKMYCSTVSNHKYCELSDICIPGDRMCPMGPSDSPHPMNCPGFAPHSCWKLGRTMPYTTYPKMCYTDDEKCDGVDDCAEGEDEYDCDDEKASSKYLLLIVIVTGAASFAATLGIFFLCRRWKRKKRLRRDPNDDNSIDIDAAVAESRDPVQYGPSPNPPTGQPPPCYSGEYNEDIVEEEGDLPPPYVLQQPSNEGPQSVLPSYTDVLRLKSSEGDLTVISGSQLGSQSQTDCSNLTDSPAYSASVFPS